MATKYPIILVHGVAAKQLRIMNAFGRIGHKLADAGYTVFVADTDGFGTVESNAHQLKSYVLGVLKVCKVKKVNIIAHSKGGLDAKYMITHLGMEERVASLTTLCTPHRGSIIYLLSGEPRTCALMIWFIRTSIRFLFPFFGLSFFPYVYMTRIGTVINPIFIFFVDFEPATITIHI